MRNYNNYLNIEEKDYDKPIYRVFKLEHFLELMFTKTLVLTLPKLWDDPFENYILNSSIMKKNGNISFFAFRDDFYGQCWTLNKETDAMWRIYSPNKNGVKVKTTIKKLYNSLYDSQKENKQRDISCFIGKVIYLSQKKLLKSLENKKLNCFPIISASCENLARTLLVKRNEFKHEKEVRLIYDSGNTKNKQDLFRFKIKPFDLYDEIVFDPRMEFFLYTVFLKFLIGIGYKKIITKSKLYQLSNRPIKM
ncbi:MAG: DUF2971 domain-containing protein [Candidatus Cloacimonetes bacterium]|nr:DUF2971 domain-containing protein [Candidatus Cloacimonadota bacterium]